MMKNTVAVILVFALPAAAGVKVQTWNATSPEWSVNAANWDGGEVWAANSAAVFGASGYTNVVVPARTTVYSMDFTQGNWTISGTGSLVSEVFGLAPDDSDRNHTVYLNVAEGASVDFAVGITNNYAGNYEQRGKGSVTLSKPAYLFRTAVYGGTLNLEDMTLVTAKIQDYSEDNSSKLHLDGVVIAPVNNNTILGETGDAFADVTVGAGGVTFTNIPGVTTQTDFIRLKHPMRPSDDLGDASDGGVTQCYPGNFYIDSGTCDLKGGFRFLNGTNHLENIGAIGKGPVYLDARLCVVDSVTITNEVTFGPSGILVLDEDAESAELPDVGFSSGNTERRAAFDSATGGGTVRLVTDAETAPFGGFALGGGVGVVSKGDVWTACAGVISPFVSALRSCPEMPYVKVNEDGLVFDTNGEDVSLGARIVFTGQATTNYVVEAFDNGSFEEGEEGWTFTGGKGGLSDIRSNGGPFDGGKPAYQTPYPDNYAQVRSNGGSVSAKFSPSRTGEYRIAFEYANRYDKDPEGLLTWGVYVDGTAIREKANDGLGNHGFMTYLSPTMTLEAGREYTFKFETGPSIDEVNGFDSMLVDAVRLERVESVSNPFLTKKGEGSLRLGNPEAPGVINVEEGCLVTEGSLTGMEVNVSSGATFAFAPNYRAVMLNPGFEVGTETGGNGVSYSGKITGWTLYPEAGVYNMPGWQRDGGAASAGGPHTTNGGYTAFMRPSNAIATHVIVPAEGVYTLSFEYALRRGESYLDMTNCTLTAYLDGNAVRTIPLRDAANKEFTEVSVDYTLEAGMHELRFETDNAAGLVQMLGYMVFVDDIRLESQVDSYTDNVGRWNLASGSTLDTGDMDIVLNEVYVDGVRVTGATSAFRAAGVTVSGSGSLRSGLAPKFIMTLK